MLSQVGGPRENLFKGDYVVPGQEISVNHVHPMKKDVLQKITFLSNCTVSLTKKNNTRMHIQTGLSGGRLNKKDGLTRYGDSHVKDKTS